MKIFRLPAETRAIIFDMDGTLYTHAEYLQSQTDLPIMRLAQLQGKSYEKMSEEIAEYRKNWAASHGGKSLSLGNTFINFGVSIEENIKWREELCRPEKYLCEDKRLRETLLHLASGYALAVVTNNPVSVAQRTLLCLGVQNIFTKIVGLDTCGVSKPHKLHFLTAAELCGTAPVNCVSVGDRYDIDIALPLELEMGGILVDGVEDIYKLNDIFK